MACRMCLLVVLVSAVVVCLPSDSPPGERSLVAGVWDQAAWSTPMVDTSSVIFLDLGDQLIRYVIRAVSHFLGNTLVKAVLKGIFYAVKSFALSLLEVEVAALEGGSLDMMRNVFETLLRYLHHTWTGITWLDEAAASLKYGAEKELQNYLGAMVASAGYVGAAYGMGYMGNVDPTQNTENALQAVMYYLPPHTALWAGKLASSFVSKSIFGLMF